MVDAFSGRSGDAAVPESGALGHAEPGRALVPSTTPTASKPGLDRGIRPDARFVAQLIATANFAPQTRALRRANPDDAVTSYARLRCDLPAAANGAALSLVA